MSTHKKLLKYIFLPLQFLTGRKKYLISHDEIHTIKCTLERVTDARGCGGHTLTVLKPRVPVRWVSSATSAILHWNGTRTNKAREILLEMKARKTQKHKNTFRMVSNCSSKFAAFEKWIEKMYVTENVLFISICCSFIYLRTRYLCEFFVESSWSKILLLLFFFFKCLFLTILLPR